jgi:hypothetical protein
MCLQHVVDNNDMLVVVCVDDITSSGSNHLTSAMMAVLLTTTYIQNEAGRDAGYLLWSRLQAALHEIVPVIPGKPPFSEEKDRQQVIIRSESVLTSFYSGHT